MPSIMLPRALASINRLTPPRCLRSLRSSRSSRFQTHQGLATCTKLAARANPLARPRESARNASPEQAAHNLLSHYSTPPPVDARPPSIVRALVFLVGFSALSFTGAAVYSLSDTEHVAAELRASRDVFANVSSFFFADSGAQHSVWGAGVTQSRLEVAKQHQTAARLGVGLECIVGWCNQLHLPAALTEFVTRSYIMCAEQYLELSPSNQTVLPVVAINTIVFSAWMAASAKTGGRMWRFMHRNFVHRPSSNAMSTMVTSVFSHHTFLHFVFNNVALWSFGSAAVTYAAHRTTQHPIAESSPTPHFMAFFASAGVFAATVSHIVSAIRFRRIASLHALSTARTTARTTVAAHASLGSSGAVYAALIMSAAAFPDAQVGIMLLPMVSFPIGMGVAGLVAVDVVGILLRWRVFDHWAHLGGAAFGWWYWHYGGEWWTWLKRVLLQTMRGGSQCQSGLNPRR